MEGNSKETAPVLDKQHVTIDVNVNVNRNEIDVRSEIQDFALWMELQLSEMTEDLENSPVEELVRLLEESLGQFKAAISLQVSPETVGYEACKAANLLMAAANVYCEDYKE